MRQITLTALAVLCAATVLSAAVSTQAKNDAEQLFHKMEAKLDKAKAIDLSFAVTFKEQFDPIQTGTRFKGTLPATSGNKGRMAMSGGKADGGAPFKLLMVSDGTQAIFMVGGESKPKPSKVPKNLTAKYLTLLARSGFVMSIMPLPPDVFAKEDVDCKEGFPVSRFKLGKKQKVGERETQQVTYSLGVKGQQIAYLVTVWIDLKTGFPVKRQVAGSYAETYELTLDGKLDPKMFELPK